MLKAVKPQTHNPDAPRHATRDGRRARSCENLDIERRHTNLTIFDGQTRVQAQQCNGVS